MAKNGEQWTLEELIDFEVLLRAPKANKQEVGRELRNDLGEAQLGDNEVHRKRWGLKYWLHLERSQQENLMGHRVTAACRLIGLVLLVGMFLVGLGVVRGLVTEYSYEGVPYQVEGEAGSPDSLALSDFRVTPMKGQIKTTKGFNIWIFLFASLGVQWLLLIGGLIGFLLFRHWVIGLKALLSNVVRRFAGGIDRQNWECFSSSKKSLRSVFSWRLGSLLQLGGVGFNMGLIIGLLAMLWFSQVGFFWESTLPAGTPSLEKTTSFLSTPWGQERPSDREIELTKIRSNSDYRFEDIGTVHTFTARSRADLSWALFFFLAISFWGFLPRVLLLSFSIWKERRLLSQFDFQDREHRQLWRELSNVERSISMEGAKDGVVLFDVGGMEIPTGAIRPFLLQQLRVNPESRFQLGVLDSATEGEAWAAMMKAPSGAVILVEGWNLSPKQFTHIWQRMRQTAGEEMMIRVVVLGDGGKSEASSPSQEEFSNWQKIIDGLRDPLIECVAYQTSKIA